MYNSLRIALLVCALYLPGAFSPASAAPLGAVGALGDSLTHEYQSWIPVLGPNNGINNYNSTMLGWTEHLSQSGVNFGAWVDAAGLPKQAHNAAIGGLTSISAPYLPELLEAFDLSDNGQRDVRTVFIGIGANNFLDSYRESFGLPQGFYRYIYNGPSAASYDPLTNPVIEGIVAQTVNDIALAVTNVKAIYGNDMQFVLATIPDLGVTPDYRQNFPNASRRGKVSLVVEELNARLIELADSLDAPVVDLAALAAISTAPTFELAGESIINGPDRSMTVPGMVSGNYMYLADGFHPGTILHGLIANAFLEAMHRGYGADVDPYRISDQEILERAGLSRPTGTTYFDVTPYVIVSVPEPASMILSACGFLCLFLGVVRKRASRGLAALLLAAVATAAPSNVQAGPLDAIGIVGTSLSEEYAATDIFQAIGAGYPGPGVNWMEILAVTRPELNFGQYSANWGDLRQGGYQYNWAEGGSTSATIISTGQVAGLANQVASGQVKMAVIEIGMNDFLTGPGNSIPILQIGLNQLRGAALTTYLDQIVNNVRYMIETIQAAAPEPIPIVLFNAPNPMGVPLGQNLVASFSQLVPGASARVNAAAAALSLGLDGLAATHGVVIADIHSVSTEWSQGNTVMIGDTPVTKFNQELVNSLGINFRALADDPVALAAAYDSLPPEIRAEMEAWAFLPDGFHPNTVASAMVANQFLAALNSELNANVPLLTPEEILYAAGIQPVPEPGTLVLAAAGLLGLGTIAVRRRAAKA